MRYFAFDFDDNILHTDTKIYMNKVLDNKKELVALSSSEYANVRTLPNYEFINESFNEFRDYGKRGKNAFIEDFKNAVNNKQFAPSYKALKKCIINGSIFAIITARGHEIDVIKDAFYWLITKVFTYEEQVKFYENNSYKFNCKFSEMVSKYLDSCRFYCVSNPNYEKTCQSILDEKYTTEIGKVIALEDFINYVKSLSKGNIKIGFSDDDINYISKVRNYMINCADNNLHYYLFNTSDKAYKREKIQKLAI